MNLRPHLPIIIVHCPQKVGSTSLVSSLRLFALHKYEIFHIHDERIFPLLGVSEEIKTVPELVSNLAKERKVYVIQIYKPQIERLISCFFEHLSAFHYNTTDEQINKYSIDKLSKRFNQSFFHIGEWNGKYGKENYVNKNGELDANIEVIELCCGNDIKKTKLAWSNKLSNILNTKISVIVDRPTTHPKYKIFKEEYRIPLIILNKLKEKDTVMSRYLNTEEIENYYTTWYKKSIDTIPYALWTDEQYKFYYEISAENQTNNIISFNHYADTGCACMKCMNKRVWIRNNLLKLTQIPPVIH